MADTSLGQHWLFDSQVLDAMCNAVDVSPGDNVLEIGPGLGTLTQHLLDRGAKVTAVEFDDKLIDGLRKKFEKQEFTLIHKSITTFDFSTLPDNYKIVANIPYYLTSHLLRMICEAAKRPQRVALLVQKEVAERVAAPSGDLSLLAVSIQIYAKATLGQVVPAILFAPPPKVDSRILILNFYPKPLVDDPSSFMRVVKAGFANPRKKLRNSYAAGLHLEPQKVDEILSRANIDGDRRAQTLSIEEWGRLSELTYS